MRKIHQNMYRRLSAEELERARIRSSVLTVFGFVVPICLMCAYGFWSARLPYQKLMSMEKKSTSIFVEDTKSAGSLKR